MIKSGLEYPAFDSVKFFAFSWHPTLACAVAPAGSQKDLSFFNANAKTERSQHGWHIQHWHPPMASQGVSYAEIRYDSSCEALTGPASIGPGVVASPDSGFLPTLYRREFESRTTDGRPIQSRASRVLMADGSHVADGKP